MRAHPFKSLLLILVLVLSQWAAFAHVSKHAGQSLTTEQTCEFCLHAQGLGAGLAAIPKIDALHFAHELPVRRGVPSVIAIAPAHYPIRGPPAFFA